MAATAKNMAGGSDDSSSSSDDEVMKRCKEAVWETRSDSKKDGEIKVQLSKRFVVADHEHDCNELQVTPGFRTHVAAKLGRLLEGSIAETYTENVSCVEPKRCDNDDDEEGFRLFSTSVPGQAADDPPAPVRRRPVPSSSDSDSEMETRLMEAAVSVKDILSQSSQLSTPVAPSASQNNEKKRKVAEGEESHVCVAKKKKKRKKKKKQNQEGSEQVDVASSPCAQRTGEQEDTQVKVKRKKKKKQRELHTEELN
uniref:Protein CUSTOS n=1 Tax=Gasterosteus aculeatus aculeatus TaxID=481459 RepID=A0AAQ4R7I6_GASAC|nr:protein CUSTOS isoform X1 [Gasterosteus aculeatus aculeatus]